MVSRAMFELRNAIAEILKESDAIRNFDVNRKIVITAGSPGSGKSTVSKLILGGLGFSNRDIDDMLVYLLKREKMRASMTDYTPEELKKTDELRGKTFSWIEKSQDYDLKRGRGFIVNTTGANFGYTMSLVKKFKEAGYEVKMLFVDCSLETALERNRKRPRAIPENVLKQKHAQVSDNLEKYRAAFGGDFHYYNSDENKPTATDAGVLKISKDIQNWRNAR